MPPAPSPAIRATPPPLLLQSKSSSAKKERRTNFYRTFQFLIMNTNCNISSSSSPPTPSSPYMTTMSRTSASPPSLASLSSSIAGRRSPPSPNRHILSERPILSHADNHHFTDPHIPYLTSSDPYHYPYHHHHYQPNQFWTPPTLSSDYHQLSPSSCERQLVTDAHLSTYYHQTLHSASPNCVQFNSPPLSDHSAVGSPNYHNFDNQEANNHLYYQQAQYHIFNNPSDVYHQYNNNLVTDPCHASLSGVCPGSPGHEPSKYASTLRSESSCYQLRQSKVQRMSKDVELKGPIVGVGANKKERRRTVSINSAFASLRSRIPNVPEDTKLSKIKTLRLATSYIIYLMDILSRDDAENADTEFKVDLTRFKRPRNSNNHNNIHVSSSALMDSSTYAKVYGNGNNDHASCAHHGGHSSNQLVAHSHPSQLQYCTPDLMVCELYLNNVVRR